MHNDEIDEMLTGAVPVLDPGRRRRSLTENSVNRVPAGHFEGHWSDSFLQWNDRSLPIWILPQTPPDDRRRDEYSNEGL
jgi:hypothetical protein